MSFPFGLRRVSATRRFIISGLLVATLAGAGASAAAQGANAAAAPAPAGEPAVNPPKSGQVAFGEIPAGLPTVDQPAPAGQAPRTLSPGNGQTSWDTFMYEGPGYRYSVIDEVSQGQLLQIVACSDDWCKVAFDGGRRGYIIAEVLTSGDPAKAETGFLPNPATAIIPNPPGPCFDALQTEGNGGKMPTRYCQKASQ
jgi:hypothetical protein